MTKDMSHDFAKFAVETKYEDIPEDARDAAKKSLLDTVGVIIAASGLEPAVAPVAELAVESGGRAESAILGFGGRVPALMASFVNGAMAHCLDFDDHAPEGHHPSSSIVPATLAIAERIGGVSGKELITAIALGQDMFLRLRRNVGWKQDWHLTTVVGVFSATASCGRVLGLTQEQMVNAFGIAGTQSSGTLEFAYGVGCALRGMYAGFTSKAAVLSALMAEKGVTGPEGMFEGKAGFFNVYFDGEYDRAKILDGLGRDFTGGSLLYKPWPSCGVSHTFIHATIEAMRENALTVADIDEIRVHVGDFQSGLCEPLDRRRKPETPPDAKFSIPFCVAVAATKGDVRLGDFTSKGLADQDVLAAAEKVVPVIDSSRNWTAKLPDGKIDIVTRDGRTVTRIGDNVPGDIEAPMDWDYLSAKFREAASFSKQPLAPEAIEQAENLIRGLEGSNDATELVRVLTTH